MEAQAFLLELAVERRAADAEAARVYAQSFGKDAEFYDFYRAMQSYRHTFGADGGPRVPNHLAPSHVLTLGADGEANTADDVLMYRAVRAFRTACEKQGVAFAGDFA